jgi:hypothetical protein
MLMMARIKIMATMVIQMFQNKKRVARKTAQTIPMEGMIRVTQMMVAMILAAAAATMIRPR